MNGPFTLKMKVVDGRGVTIQKYSVHELKQADLVEVQEVIIDALKPLGRHKLEQNSMVGMTQVKTNK